MNDNNSNNTSNNELEIKPIENNDVHHEEQINEEVLTPTVENNVNNIVDSKDKVEIDEKTTVEMENVPHDVPIPDEKNDKDFVIKSKKETVAEDVKLRESKIEEHIKKANENYKPNSKFKNFLLIVFLLFIILFTIFLPQINEFMAKLQSGELKPQEEIKITDGTLNCTYEKLSEKYTYNYEYDFDFTNNKLNSYTKTVSTKGDASQDTDELNELKSKCKTMKDESNDINGLDVKCESDTNSSTVIEIFNLGSFNNKNLTTSYTEAGGDYPEYTIEQDMDVVEKNMKASGFTCQRIASLNNK